MRVQQQAHVLAVARALLPFLLCRMIKSVVNIVSPNPIPAPIRNLKLYFQRMVIHCKVQVEIEDVETEDKRYQLFLDLLETTRKREEFQQLMLLLQAWPPMIKEEV
ncbi:unnamed protein product [Merluccius merluccius]